MKLAPILFPLVIAALLGASCSSPPRPLTITAPPAERIAALLDFAGPVSLTCHVTTDRELAHIMPQEWGIPVASFSYADPQHSSETILINVFNAGAFLGDRRAKLITRLTELPKEVQAEGVMGVFKAADGRPIYQTMLAIGMGGGLYGAWLPSRDARYELVVLESTDAHDGKDQTLFAHHVRAREQPRSVIEAIESLVFP